MKRIASLACALALGASAAAPPLPLSTLAAEGVSPSRFERVVEFVAGVTAGGEYLGAVSLVARNGKLVDWRAYGHRDLARASAMEPDSIFRIYSMTKPMLTVAVLKLVEEGHIASVDDPVSKYLPAFATRPVTLRQLLTHTSGFANATEAMERSADLKAYSGLAARLASAGESGKRFHYNAVNSEVASRVVEVVSGTTFDAYLRERIFVPLGMRDTSFTVPAEKLSRLAEMTSTDKDGKLVAHDMPRPLAGEKAMPGRMMRPYFSGAGGLYSTAADYARFCQMLLNGGELDGARILARDSVDQMMTSQLANMDGPMPGEGFGLGGYVVLDAARLGRPGSAGAFGWLGAGGTYFTIDRRERLVAILMTQHIPQGLPKDPQKLAARFYNLVYPSLVE